MNKIIITIDSDDNKNNNIVILEKLINNILEKKSFLCVGLDTDFAKIPKHLLDFDDPIYEFNKRIIDATKDYCVAYKPNIAFYECHGSKGWDSLKKTIDYIPDNIFSASPQISSLIA